MIATQLSQLEPACAKGLCLQFILHEYTKSLSIASNLEKSLPPQAALKEWGSLVTKSLDASFSEPNGTLDKLCIYCEALVQSSKIGEELLHATEELRTSISLHFFRLSRSLPIEQDFFLSQKLAALFSYFTPLFKACDHSESALFALLELRAKINGYLGPRTVENLLQQLFPGGPKHFRETLSHGFASRGFTDFCLQHETLFEGLAWPSDPLLSPPSP